ncbi:MAG: type I-B CRISPR-associated protein Cas5b [Candidatus Omnitrophica bacterium]|nr:type I-B CRISPR-associated protein Cas5b [Candidatus Omnitrophota bacterium]
MKILRVKIYQPHAHYRIPFTYQRRHTYPIPPYSTVIGLICNILGIKDHFNEDFKKLKEGLSLAIYGKFESMTKEYIWFRNLEKKSHISRFGSAENRMIDQIPEHPGGQMPTRIDVLENVNLIIYAHHNEQAFLNKLEESFKNPEKRIYPLHLGRAEDWVIFDGNPEEAIKIIEVDENDKEPFYGKFEYYTWIPNPERAKEYIDEKIYNDDFKKIYPKIKGSLHLITSLYELKNGFRNFEHIPVKLFEQGDFPFYFGKPFRFIKDKELDIPLFLCKVSKKEE